MLMKPHIPKISPCASNAVSRKGWVGPQYIGGPASGGLSEFTAQNRPGACPILMLALVGDAYCEWLTDGVHILLGIGAPFGPYHSRGCAVHPPALITRTNRASLSGNTGHRLATRKRSGDRTERRGVSSERDEEALSTSFVL